MTVVRMPNGDLVEMGSRTDDEIRTLIRSKFPDFGKPSVAEDMALAAGSGAITGLHTIPGLGGDVETLARVGNEYIDTAATGAGNWLRGLAGYRPLEQKQAPPVTDTLLPTSEEVQQFTGWDKAKYQPQTTAGKIVGSAAEFVPGAIALGPGSVVKGAVNVGKNILRYGAIPGAASEAAGQAAEASPFPQLAPVARFAGGVGAGVAGGVRRAAPRPPPLPTARDELLSAAGRQGIQLPRAAASDNRLVQGIGQQVANVTLGGGKLRQASEQAIEQMGQAAENVARGFGRGALQTPATAGASARAGLTRYIGPTTKARVTKAYDAVDSLVDPAITTKLDNTAKIATRIVSQRQAGAVSGPGGAVSMVQEGILRPQGLTYQGLKKLRTHIGEMIDDKSLMPAGTSQAELKQIYEGLTNDLREAVRRGGGPEALRVFNRANTYNRLVNERRENLIRLLGANNDEGVFDRIAAAAGSNSRADINQLMQARKAVSREEWDDIASAVVGRMGIKPGGAGGGTGSSTVAPAGGFSAQSFLTDYKKMSPTGRRLLFGTTGHRELSAALDDVATVSQRFRELQRFANPSGTSQNVTSVIQLGGMAGSIMTEPITAATYILGPAVAARVMAKPATARNLAAWGRAYTNYARTPNRQAQEALSFAARMFAISIGQENGLKDYVPQMTQALSNPQPAPPDRGPGQAAGGQQ